MFADLGLKILAFCFAVAHKQNSVGLLMHSKKLQGCNFLHIAELVHTFSCFGVKSDIKAAPKYTCFKLASEYKDWLVFEHFLRQYGFGDFPCNNIWFILKPVICISPFCWNYCSLSCSPYICLQNIPGISLQKTNTAFLPNPCKERDRGGWFHCWTVHVMTIGF